jgi:hypothetical protein
MLHDADSGGRFDVNLPGMSGPTFFEKLSPLNRTLMKPFNQVEFSSAIAGMVETNHAA